MIAWCWLNLLLFAVTIYWLQYNWMKPCNVVHCILKIKCSLNLSVSYICFDICGCMKRASSRGHRAANAVSSKVLLFMWYTSALGLLRINFTCIFNLFHSYFPQYFSRRFVTRAILVKLWKHKWHQSLIARGSIRLRKQMNLFRTSWLGRCEQENL